MFIVHLNYPEVRKSLCMVLPIYGNSFSSYLKYLLVKTDCDNIKRIDFHLVSGLLNDSLGGNCALATVTYHWAVYVTTVYVASGSIHGSTQKVLFFRLENFPSKL